MSKVIKICKGPGCKEWDSENMAKKFRQKQGSQGICLVPCMEKCGGGVSVQVEGYGEVLKIRDSDEVVHFIDSSNGALVNSC